jgi:cytochrome c-type biogenesis protein CcmH/NrfG
MNYVRVFLLYILQTQEREAIELFQDALRRHAPEVGGHLMTYAQELEEQGKIKERLAIIETLLRLGEEWARIEEITGVNETQFEALKQQVADMTE